MPYLHEVDFAAINKFRAKEGLKMGATKEGRQREPVSKVVRRHLAIKIETSLYKN
jgi:hypothetical protein